MDWLCYIPDSKWGDGDTKVMKTLNYSSWIKDASGHSKQAVKQWASAKIWVHMFVTGALSRNT